MNLVQTGMWDPHPPSKHASSLPPPPRSRLTHVTTATPAKRITFYKSGDNQFGGVRMAIHKRSFKCFDTLLDDLSQKVPLPFGVRTVTTPRGTHTIKHLEQLQDGGCYLCSDRRQVKPLNMWVGSKHPSNWYHQNRRPQRPETSSTTPPGHSHMPYRQRRILLVKNSEPGMRRSMVLSRRSTRSLRAFLDEVSEVMQFHVRKLYSVEGRRIDSVQTLMTCPGVLVCVGREAFSPLLVNFIRKTSEEKLPGLSSRSPGLGPRTPGNGARSPAAQGVRSPPHGAQSRASEYSEGLESKKNVNFGLETKKSIIHPRSDSSNRSARFSLSSEKSYSNGLSGRAGSMNDDIEKRVLVNKDGSLSVEMRVRFHLHNDETVQWSTNIKKTPSLTNESCPLGQAQSQYLQQGQSESCSDPDSMTYDPEGVDYSSQPGQSAMEGNHCPCCYQRQEQQYDLWENPVHSHKQPPVPPPHTSGHTHTTMRHTHSSSSSSSCNSRRVLRCRARLSACKDGSDSEQGQLVQEEVCVTEQVEHRVEVEQHGDTHVEVCKVSRCCSRNEVVATHGEITMEEEERPMSVVSSTSHVLQSLKEDQDLEDDEDDEDDDLPPSASQCCHSIQQSPEESGNGDVRAASSCRCGASTAGAEETDRAPSATSKVSEARNPKSEEEVKAGGDEEVKRVLSGLSGHTGLSAVSQKSGLSGVCSDCGGCKRAVNSISNSRASQRSNCSNRASPNPENTDGSSDDAASAVSTQSNKSNLTNGRLSAASNVLEVRASNNEPTGKQEERAPSAASATSQKSSRSKLSAKSTKSHKSTAEAPDITSREEAEGENAEERAVSCLSDKSGASVKPNRSSCQSSTKAASPAVDEDDSNKKAASNLSVRSNVSAKSGKPERPDSVQSAKSIVSAKSHRSTSSHRAKAVSPSGPAADEPVIDVTGEGEGADEEERAVSAMSAKSNSSATSNKSHKSTGASEKSLSPRTGDGGDGDVRATSQMSVKSNRSVKSTKPSEPNCNGIEMPASPTSKVEEEVEEAGTQQRPESKMSAKSAASSKSHRSGCNKNTGEASEIADVTKDAENAEDRAASALSAKSASSAKSSKSRKSKQTAASPNPNDAHVPLIETSREDTQNETQERAGSAISVKSKSSMRSRTSHKASKNLLSPNVVTIKMPGGPDEETKERSASAASVKSNASPAVSKSDHNETADTAVAETADEKEISHGHLSPRKTRSSRTASPTAPSTKGSPSPVQQLLPGPDAGETRGPSTLSVYSATSSKSDRSRCRCGVTSALEKENKEKESDDSKIEETSERAASILSSRRQRRESGGTEPPLSRNSSGSVSLGLPEEQDTADSDSGKSSVSFHRDSESRGKARVVTVAPKAPKSPNGSIRSQKSNAKKIASSHNTPAVDIPTIETPGAGEDEGEEGGEQHAERADSHMSVKSSRSHKAPHHGHFKAIVLNLTSKSKENLAGGGSPKVGNDVEIESVKSASTTKASNLENRTSSARSSASGRVRSKSAASTTVKNTAAGETASKDNENQDSSRPGSRAKGKEDNVSQSPCCLRPASATSRHSESKIKASKQANAQKVKSNADDDNCSIKTSTSQKKETSIKSSSPCPVHSPERSNGVETHSESTLSHSLSAADLLKETMAASRPDSQQSKASKTSDKPRSKKSGRGQSSRNLKDQEEVLVLTPACLPNSSPNEVVSDWLRSIPANSSVLALGDELNEDGDEPKEEEEEEEEEEEQGTPGEESSEKEKVETEEKAGPEEEEAKEEEAQCDAAQEEKSLDRAPGDIKGTSLSGAPLPSDEMLAKNWHSSAAVMKVLLNSSLGRCRSLPEVSPVYGRRLSTSARGLLDCLTQLQLIEPAAGLGCNQQKSRNHQYEDIMAILHSLWLTEPRDTKGKDGGPEQVTPPRSSSGVYMSSGSGKSGKDNRNQEGDETPPKQSESLHDNEAAENVPEEEGNAAETEREAVETSAEEAREDAAEEAVQSEEQNAVDQSPDATESRFSFDKSFANESSKSPTDNEREMQEDSGSGSPSTVLRAPLSKRLSQDPDPVWVLNLLKKLEKQFMNHYINAMVEFKVRWDLDDSLILDTMISELKDEVSQRIQSSIEREMRKIQSRAGRGGRSPRPPQGGHLSRESTMTGKRRKMLKVMKNQSVKTADSLSDGETTGELDHQRSEDDYCPCDACVRKKMDARPANANPLAAEAPVMMEFDLLKILQLKKTPSPASPTAPQPSTKANSADEAGRNLEVVQEEEEEEKGEEEEEEEGEEEEGQEKDEGQAGEEEETGGEKEENSAGDEEEEEGVTGGDEGDEETSEHGEEEEEGQCQCQCAGSEEESDNEGEGEGETAEGEEADETSNNEDVEERSGEEEGVNVEDEGETGGNETEENEGGTGQEEEESDKGTVKEVTEGEGETTENAEGEEEEEEEGEEGEEEGEETAANEESSVVEEFVEGNVSGSAEAEDEDDGEDGTGQGESEEATSEEGRASQQGQGATVCVTEGEEADAEDSDERPSAEESGREGGKDSGGDADEEDEVVEDAVEELRPEEEANKTKDGALLHQFTRTSMESQPGSLEDVESPSNPADSIEVPKVGSGASTGGTGGRRRSRSPARVKRRKPKVDDDDLDNF